MTDKINLIIDFNNIASRALFACQYGGDQPVGNFDTDSDCAVLARKIVTDIAYVLRLFNPSRTVFVCDSRNPWRASLYRDIDNGGYKGTRHKDENKNWQKIYATWDKIKTILKKCGFVVCEIPSAEADDLAALWRNRMLSAGESVILVSSDRDWTQLVNHTDNTFCICFSPVVNNKGKKKLYLTKSCYDWLYSADTVTDIFFTNYSISKQNISKIFERDSKIETEIIDPDYVVLSKVMCGDDCDNAPAIYEFYKNGKKVRMTELRSKKIFESLGISNIHDLCAAGSNGELKKAISRIFKRDVEDIDMDERIMRQRKLVELNESLFPREIVDTFEYMVDDNKVTGYVPVSNIKIDTILAGTEYLNSDFKKPKVNSIFDNLQDLNKFIKPLSNSLF